MLDETHAPLLERGRVDEQCPEPTIIYLHNQFFLRATSVVLRVSVVRSYRRSASSSRPDPVVSVMFPSFTMPRTPE